MFSNIQLITAGSLENKKGHHRRGSRCFTTVTGLRMEPIQRFPNYQLFHVSFPAVWIRHGYEQKYRCEIKFCHGIMPVPTMLYNTKKEQEADMRRIIRSVKKLDMKQVLNEWVGPAAKPTLIVSAMAKPVDVSKDPNLKRALVVSGSRSPEGSVLRSRKGDVVRQFVVSKGRADHADIVPFYGNPKLVRLLNDEPIAQYAYFVLAAEASREGINEINKAIKGMQQRAGGYRQALQGALFMPGYEYSRYSTKVKSLMTGLSAPDKSRKLAFELGNFIDKNNL